MCPKEEVTLNNNGGNLLAMLQLRQILRSSSILLVFIPQR